MTLENFRYRIIILEKGTLQTSGAVFYIRCICLCSIISSGKRQKCQMPPLECRARNHCQIYTARTSYGCKCRKPSSNFPHHQSTEACKDASGHYATVQYALLVIYRRRVLSCNPAGRMVQNMHRYNKTSRGNGCQCDCTYRSSAFPHDPVCVALS